MAMKERKSDFVRRMVAQGDYLSALRVAKDFHLGITKEEHDAMLLGYECIVHERFYRQLGYDINELTNKAICIINGLYKT